jgi:hypothetical protein
VLYAVIGHDAAQGTAKYTGSLGQLAKGAHTGQPITLPTAENIYDVYVRLFKDGKAGAPHKIDTTDFTSWVPGGPGRFLAYNNTTDEIAWSADGGISWVQATGLSGNDYRAIAYDDRNGVFLTLGCGAYYGNKKVAISTDGGATWVNKDDNLPKDALWLDAAYGNGVFVATGGYYADIVNITNWTPIVAWSDNDGQTWNYATKGPTEAICDVSYGNGVFIGPSGNKESNKVFRSTDGKTWTAVTLPTAAYLWEDVAYGDGVFVIIGYDRSQSGSIYTYTPKVAWSNNGGLNWTVVQPPGNNILQNIAFGGGAFVVSSYNSTTVLWSYDGGKNWTSSSPIFPSPVDSSNVAYGNGVFVMMGKSSNTPFNYRSVDGGKNWTEISLPSGNLYTIPTYGEPPAAP